MTLKISPPIPLGRRIHTPLFSVSGIDLLDVAGAASCRSRDAMASASVMQCAPTSQPPRCVAKSKPQRLLPPQIGPHVPREA